MLGEIFYWIFNMSITAAVAGLIVLLIRACRKIPRRVVCCLWAVPFLRMAVPLGFNSPFSLLSLLSRFTVRTVTVYAPADGVAFSLTNCVMAADSYFPITYKVNLVENLFSAASVVWSVVLLAAAAALIALYFSAMHQAKSASPLRDNVYLSEKILSPAVYGILRPRILLPASFAERDLAFILRHERMHIRRADNLWRMLAFLITAIHWFNPFAWLFLRLFLADLELACDEGVIAGYSLEQRKAYALSLLKCKNNTTVFAAAFGGARIRTRIENILSFRNVTRISAVGFSALAIAIAAVLLTNAG